VTELVCQCDDALGLSHSHIMARRFTRHPFWSNQGGESYDTGWCRIWMDWKDVARELAHAPQGDTE
jgi:hypothetical protein